MNRTIGASFERSGVGLHSGVTTQVRVLPAGVGEGRYFVRVDLPKAPVVPAKVEGVAQTVVSTELAQPEAQVRTVEHLLAALAASGVDNARIEIDSAEVPLMDGSAQDWVEAVAQVGIVWQEFWEAGERGQWKGTRGQGERRRGEFRETQIPAPGANALQSQLPKRARKRHSSLLTPHSSLLPEPLWIQEEDAFVGAIPASEIRFTYGIDFDLPAIGNQWHSWSPSQSSFAASIAPARTFGLADQIEQLRSAGLIKGGSLENALVCSDRGWLNPPLRFANEPVRHKLLDLVGDLSLLGSFPKAHFLAYKASHKLHIQLAQALCDSQRQKG